VEVINSVVRSSALLFLVVLSNSLLWSQAPHSHATGEISSSNWSELLASMDKMHSDMALIKTSGDDDVDFVRLMLPHHQAAIGMAKTLLANGKDPQVRRLAQEIITDQQSEIELMQLWLKGHEHKTVHQK
jgi:uncharacterized protein (DUF305 family)